MKKKLLPIALLCALGLVGCAETPAPTETETNTQTETTQAEANVTSLKFGNASDLTAEWRLGDADRTIDITSTEPINANKELSKGNLKIVSSDSNVVSVIGRKMHAVGEGYATVTAQWKDTNVKQEIRIEVKRKLPTEGVVPVASFDVDGTYKLGLYQKLLKKTLIFTNEVKENAYASDEDYKKGAAVTIVASETEGAYNLKVGDKFLDITRAKVDNAWKPTIANSDTATDWTYSKELKTFVKSFTTGEGDAAVTDTYVIATKAKATTFEAIDINDAKAEDVCVAKLQDFKGGSLPASEVKAGKFLLSLNGEYFLQADHTRFNMKATKNAADASVVELIAAGENKFNIKVKSLIDDDKGAYKYLAPTSGDNGKHVNLRMVDEKDKGVFEWSAQYKNFTTVWGAGDGAKKVKVVFDDGYKEFACKDLKDKAKAATVYTTVEFADSIGVKVEQPKDVVLYRTKKASLKLTVYPSGANQAAEWTSDNTGVIKIDSKTGEMEGKAVGTANITAKAGTVTTKISVTVVEPEHHAQPATKWAYFPEVLEEGITDNVLFRTQVVVKSWATDWGGDVDDYYSTKNYGSMLVTDIHGENETFIRKSSAAADSIAWNEIDSYYFFKGPKDFLTNEVTKNIRRNDVLDILCYRADYNGKVQLNAQILNVEQREEIKEMAEPEAITGKTLKDINDVNVSKLNQSYAMDVKVKEITDDKVGAMVITDADGKNETTVLNTTGNKEAFNWRRYYHIYEFANREDFSKSYMTNKIKAGDTLTVKLARDDDGKTIAVRLIVEKINGKVPEKPQIPVDKAPALENKEVAYLFNMTKLTGTGSYVNKETFVSTAFDSKLSTVKETTGITVTDSFYCYDGAGQGGYHDGATGLLKASSSKKNGKLELTFPEGTKITDVSLLVNKYKADETGKVEVNGLDAVEAGDNETHIGEWITFSLAEGTNKITINFTKRAYVFGLAFYTAKAAD